MREFKAKMTTSQREWYNTLLDEWEKNGECPHEVLLERMGKTSLNSLYYALRKLEAGGYIKRGVKNTSIKFLKE